MSLHLPQSHEEYLTMQSSHFRVGDILIGNFDLLPDGVGAERVGFSYGWNNGATPLFTEVEGILFKIKLIRDSGLSLEVLPDQDFEQSDFTPKELERLLYPWFLFKKVIASIEGHLIPQGGEETIRRGLLSNILYHVIAEDDDYYYCRELVKDGYPFYEPTFFQCAKDLLSAPITNRLAFHIREGKLTIDEEAMYVEDTPSD